MAKVVLLPGLDGTEVLFRPLLGELRNEAQVVEYPRAQPSSYSDLLPRVLDALPADEEYLLLGWSFSGPLALQAALTSPPGLRGVVLCASFVRKPLRSVPSLARHFVRPLLFRGFAQAAQLKALCGGY